MGTKQELITNLEGAIALGKTNLAAGGVDTTDIHSVYGIVKAIPNVEGTPAKELISIAVTTPPTTTTFAKGGVFNSNGMVVTAYYADKTTADITASVTVSTPNMNTVGMQSVTVSYEGKTDTFDITIKDYSVTSIAITNLPRKTLYSTSDTYIDTGGMVVTAFRADGTSYSLSQYVLSDVNFSTPGSKEVFVTDNITGQTTSFTICVYQTPVVVDIDVDQLPTTTTYTVGDSFNSSGLSIKGTRSDGSWDTLSSSSYSLSAPDMTTAGTKTITVTYNGRNPLYGTEIRDYFDIVVKDTTIKITTLPTKTIYGVGDTVDTTGMEVWLCNAAGNTITNVTSSVTVGSVNTSSAGIKTVTVSYNGKTDTFNIAVKDPVPFVFSTRSVYGNTDKIWVYADALANNKGFTIGGDPDKIFEVKTELLNTTLLKGLKNMACGTVGTKTYLFGGFNSSSSGYNKIQIYDNETNTVTNATAQFSTGTYDMACGTIGTKCYLFGGHTGSESSKNYLNSIMIYDTENDTLTPAADSVVLPVNITGMACGVVGTNCYLFGGKYNNNNSDTYNGDIFVYDTANNTITTLQTSPLQVTGRVACGVIGTKCYLFSGYNAQSYSKSGMIMIYDTTNNTLVASSATVPNNSIGLSSCCVIDTKCYILPFQSKYLWDGGSHTDYTVAIYDSVNDTIHTTSQLFDISISDASASLIGDFIYVFGGSNSGSQINTIYKYTPSLDPFTLNSGEIYIQTAPIPNVTPVNHRLVQQGTGWIDANIYAIYKGDSNNKAVRCKAFKYNSGWIGLWGEQ